MGVFFGVKAVTFDQAPFEKSAVAAYNPNTLEPTDPATILLAQLQHNGHTPGDLTGLTNFLQLRAANGGIPNSNLVSNIRVDGEFLSCAPFSLYHTIGTSIPPLTHGTTDVSGENLHSISLLTAFLQNDKFRDVTTKLTDLLEMIFDKNLYWFIQPTPPTQQIPTSLNSSSATKQGYKAPLPPITCLTASPTI